MSVSSIQIIDLGFSWSNTSSFLFNNINYSFVQERQYALSGISGCGKSTLLKLLHGIIRPIRGRIICTQDQANITSTVLSPTYGESEQGMGNNCTKPNAKISFLLHQNPYESFSPYLSIYAHVRDVTGLWSKVQEKLAYYLDFFSINEKMLLHKPNTLSGGTLQKLMLIKAMLQKPQILLLDEPDSFLDFESKKQLYNLLSNDPIARKALVIIATHDKQIIEACNLVKCPFFGSPAVQDK